MHVLLVCPWTLGHQTDLEPDLDQDRSELNLPSLENVTMEQVRYIHVFDII